MSEARAAVPGSTPARPHLLYRHLAEVTGGLNLAVLLAVGLVVVVLVGLMLWYAWSPAARGQEPALPLPPAGAELPDDVWQATTQAILSTDPAPAAIAVEELCLVAVRAPAAASISPCMRY